MFVSFYIRFAIYIKFYLIFSILLIMFRKLFYQLCSVSFQNILKSNIRRVT